MKLLETLDRLVHEISLSPHTEALMGLGSVSELSRMDEYSDLDFFLIVEKGYKARFIDDLFWIRPLGISYQFKNTPDGYKILLNNGVFMEFAVFELSELNHIPYHHYRLVWAKEGFDSKAIPEKILNPEKVNIDYAINEALTNLLIGLKRNARGEILTANYFIQHYAVRHVVNVMAATQKGADILVDPFGAERRFEQRFPSFTKIIDESIQGYNRNISSAHSLLTYIESIYPVNEAISKEIKSYIPIFSMGTKKIITPRLLLRTVQLTDVDDFFIMLNDPDIRKYNVMPSKTLGDVERMVQKTVGDTNTYVLEHSESHQIIGAVFAEQDNLRYGVNSVNIAYFLKTPWTKMGYMSEALEAFLHEIFMVRNIEIVTARVFVPNEASNQLLRRLGFTHEGTLKQAILGTGNIVYDDNLYVLTKKDFSFISK